MTRNKNHFDRMISQSRRNSAVMEALEGRQLFSLVGIGAELGLPLTTVGNPQLTNSTVTYSASTHQFSVSGAPLDILTSFGVSAVATPSNFQISLTVDNTGHATSSATPSSDLTMSGVVTINGTTYSGTLLTGQVEAFGYQAGSGSGVDNFDFQFQVTGGALAPAFFAGKDIGVALSDENSNFVDFNSNFSASPVKGDIGAVPPSGAPPMTISGHKYVDQTGNGLSSDDTTHPLAGVTIQLYKDTNGNGVLDSSDSLVSTHVTAADGSYAFSGLAKATYFVKEVQVSGYVETGPASGVYTVTASGNSFNFDNYKMSGCSCTCGCGSTLTTALGSLSGTVFADKDGDGHQDYNEAGISGVKITLTGTDLLGNSVSKTLTTDAYGNYKFSGLVAGNYNITETQPAGYTDGKDSVGTLGGTLGNDTMTNITVPPCGDGTCYTFGEVKTTSVCGNSGHGCCKVTLTGCDAWGRSCTYTTTTDCYGNYSFGNLCGGNWKVQECDSHNSCTSNKSFCLDLSSCQGKSYDIKDLCASNSCSSLISLLTNLLKMFC